MGKVAVLGAGYVVKPMIDYFMIFANIKLLLQRAPFQKQRK